MIGLAKTTRSEKVHAGGGRSGRLCLWRSSKCVLWEGEGSRSAIPISNSAKCKPTTLALWLYV